MPDYNDPRQGGDLSDMAATGTAMPNDAGNMRTLKSVPRPDQMDQVNDLGNDNLASAADNASDIPRVSFPLDDRAMLSAVVGPRSSSQHRSHHRDRGLHASSH